MKKVVLRELRARARAQYGLLTQRDLRLLGVSAAEQRHQRATGEWEVAAPGVYRLAGSPRTPHQELLAACFACALMEVDGFAYHADPAQVAEDKRRRTRLRLDGFIVLDYTWRDVVFDSRQVIRDSFEALAVAGPAAAGG
jgi:hypothetical protein